MPTITGITNAIGPKLVENYTLTQKLGRGVDEWARNNNTAALVNAANDALDFLVDLDSFLYTLIQDIKALDDNGFWYSDMDLIGLYNLIKGEIQISESRVRLDVAGVANSIIVVVDKATFDKVKEVEALIKDVKHQIVEQIDLRNTQTINLIATAVNEIASAIGVSARGTENLIAVAVNEIAAAISVSTVATKDAISGLIVNVRDFFENAADDIAERLWILDRGRFFKTEGQ